MFWPTVASLLFGALCGLFDPRPLYSVEIAQVVAGAVHLPPLAPMALHDGRAFSLLIDAAAVLLHAGISADLLCRILTVVMGAATSASMTIAAYAFTEDSIVALAAPVAVMSGLFTPYELAAHKYSIAFPLTGADTGVNGFSATLIILSALALRPSLGAVLLPVALAVHASLGLEVLAITGVGCLFDPRIAMALRRHWRRIAYAALAVALVWIAHQQLAAVSPAAPPVDDRYAIAVIKWWDPHRAPALSAAAGIKDFAALFTFDLAFLAVAALALAARPPALERVRFWIAGEMVVTVIAMAVVAADEVAPAWGPLPLHGLMLSRWLNVNIIVLPLLITALLLQALSGRDWLRVGRRLAGPATICAMIGILAFEARVHGHVDLWGPHGALLERVGRRPGLFVVGGDLDDFDNIQLRTRRAPLFDANLVDTIPYVPAMGAGVEHIFNDVYGVTLLDAAAWQQFGTLQSRWESWPSERWRELGKTYGVTDIIVPRSWSLNLPLADASDVVAVYTIDK